MHWNKEERLKSREMHRQQYRDRMDAIHEREAKQKAARDRGMVLEYLGGHPKVTIGGPCNVRRSEDGLTVRIGIQNQSTVINVSDISSAQLMPSSHAENHHHSGVGGAIAGDMLAGPAGAIIGGMATRKNTTKTVHDDVLVVILTDGTQVLFRDGRHRPPPKWYPKAAAIFAK